MRPTKLLSPRMRTTHEDDSTENKQDFWNKLNEVTEAINEEVSNFNARVGLPDCNTR